MKYVMSKSFLVFVMTLTFASLARAQQVAVPNEYIVKFKTSQLQQKMFAKMSSKVRAKAQFDNGMAHVELNPQFPNTLAELKQDQDVEYIEPNFILNKVNDLPGSSHSQGYDKASALSTIDSQSAGSQSASSTSSTNPANYVQSLAPTQTSDSWAVMRSVSSGPKTVVAVVDTGIDYNHELFVDSNAIWTNPGEVANNGIDDDYNGYVDDVHGWNFITNTPNNYDDDDHGTHVAGIVVGVGFNIFASPIAESKVKIMALKFLDSKGSGTTANAIKAIYYAANMGARVINNSWGGPSYSRSLHDAMTFAYSRGALIVSAAGNAGTNNDSTPMYPANYDVPSNIAVAASDDYDRKASFSNYGSQSVPVAAPGYAIWSSIPGNAYDFFSGTSMAAPFVAGVAAHAFRESPNLSGYQMRSLLISQVNASSYLSGKVTTGGRVNTLKTINSAIAQMSTSSWQPSYSPNYMNEASFSSSSPSSESGAAGCGTVALMGAGGSQYNLFGGGGSGSNGLGAMAVCSLLLLLPMVYAFYLRQKLLANPANRRRFTRYHYEELIQIELGGSHQLVAQSGTISIGGMSFFSDEKFDRDQMVTLKIRAGNEDVEVKGKIVWSKADHSYGVQFNEISENFKQMMRVMTPSLTPC